jgi:hypothetical protein
MMQFVLPFLINFGVNKAMGMSTGKALGLAGVQAFTGPAGSGGGGIGGLVGAATQGGAQMTAANLGTIAGKDLLMEGGKTLLSAQLDKRYGINPMLSYAGASALQGGIGAIGTEQGFMGGAKGAFTNPVSGKPLMAPSVPGQETSNILGLGKESGITGLGTGADIGLGIAGTTLLGQVWVEMKNLKKLKKK